VYLIGGHLISVHLFTGVHLMNNAWQLPAATATPKPEAGGGTLKVEALKGLGGR
jgi:hypothetical protein